MIHTFETFCSYFEKYKKFPDNSYVKENKKYNDKQLLTKYNSYMKSLNKRNESAKRYSENKKKRNIEKISTKEYAKSTNTDLIWVAVCKEVDIRDSECTLIKTLNPDERSILNDSSNGFHKILTHAHVLGKGAYPKFIYRSDNIYLLNQFSHSMLDSGKCPLTGNIISKEEQTEWWDRILASYGISKEWLLNEYRGDKND
jgi:hypothetical protein